MLKARQIRALSLGMASAMLDGAWAFEPMTERLADALGQRWRWRRTLVRHVLAQFPSPPSPGELGRAIVDDEAFRKAVSNRTRPRIVHWVAAPSVMQPLCSEWALPKIETAGELAARLGLSYDRLCWLADCEQRQGRADESVRRHYRWYWAQKPTGGWRLVEAPCCALKRVQRSILHQLFDRVPPHPAACGFTVGRSIIDYAAAHSGKEVVLHLDLKNFFASIPASRVHAMLTTLGYSPTVARLVTGLCTSTAPHRVCRCHAGGEIYSSPHLPQGAPTSPALANLAALGLDRRLTAAASRVGAVYTRYADDLAFSGDGLFARGLNRFLALVWRIVAEEGFEVHHRKTRVMRRSVRQRLCGLVVNEHLNVDRRYYDQLKAILTNCTRHGLDSQNRDGHVDFRAHLQGRVAFVEQVNPARGARLRALFERIGASPAT